MFSLVVSGARPRRAGDLEGSGRRERASSDTLVTTGRYGLAVGAVSDGGVRSAVPAPALADTSLAATRGPHRLVIRLRPDLPRWLESTRDQLALQLPPRRPHGWDERQADAESGGQLRRARPPRGSARASTARRRDRGRRWARRVAADTVPAPPSEAEAGLEVGAPLGHGHREELDRAGLGREQSGQHLDRGRRGCTVRAEQGEHLSPSQAAGHVVTYGPGPARTPRQPGARRLLPYAFRNVRT